MKVILVMLLIIIIIIDDDDDVFLIITVIISFFFTFSTSILFPQISDEDYQNVIDRVATTKDFAVVRDTIIFFLQVRINYHI